MLTNVVALALEGVAPFELGVVCEVFGIDRSEQNLPVFDFAVCSVGAKTISTSGGFTITPSYGVERAAEADLVAVPAMPRHDEVPDEVIEALQAAAARGARVLSVCSGAFALGIAGLLDDRRCTTHWMYTDELAKRFPSAKVDPGVLYVEDGPIITSAGTAAGIDACLHVVRQEYGVAVASAFARRMVVPPHRDGGQAQYVEAPMPATKADSLQPLLDWMTGHLDQPLTVDGLAARAAMSPRTFARRFRAETGTTPYAWLNAQRLLLAERLLEETDEPVERIARASGFGTAAALRHHFVQSRNTTPQAYRRTFCGPRSA